jgi:DNA-binding GntR family transcriptional regulator
VAGRVLQFIPRYKKIADELRQHIQDGTYKTRELIPSEVELIERFSVSRGTVREALSLLARENLLERRTGVGTIVPGKKIRYLSKRLFLPTLTLTLFGILI